MRVGAFRSEHGPALYAIYRRATARVAHCGFAPSTARFARELARPVPGETELFVAEDGGIALGFAALLSLPATDRRPARTELTALFTTDEAAGEALLGACIARARALGAGQLTAFPDEHRHCPVTAYNAGWSGLSDGMPLVARLLARHGFAPYYRELHLSLANCRVGPRPRVLPLGVTLSSGRRAGRHRVRTWRAMRIGKQVGVCIASTLALTTDDPAAARWGYVEWLYVEEAYRRQGFACRLLTAALARLADDGCAGCWLTTGADNWAVQPLYLSLGFEVVDASASFRKDLSSR